MSVRTTSDEKIDEARIKLEEAYKAILTAINPDTWGHDQYDSVYIEDLMRIAARIYNYKNKL